MRNVFLILLLIVFALAVDAQIVRNVKATQEGQKIAISYELVCTQPTEINLFLSEDNGQTWNALRTGVSGDVGLKVTQGNKVIYWDVLQSKEKLVGNAFVFKVKVGEEFKTVKIGNQVWMAENLNVDHYRNGDPIPEVKDDNQWSKLNSGAWCYHSNNGIYKNDFGKLYNGYAVIDERGICPTGWHIPSDNEWSILEKYLGGSKHAGGKMKSNSYWSSPNSGATNESGFSAVPGGCRSKNGYFDSMAAGVWWSEGECDSCSSWIRLLFYYESDLGRSTVLDMRDGLSVRCISD
jgi:uncharacterized protein (TIGR02145 family)